MKYMFTALLSLVAMAAINAQDEDLLYEDYVYTGNIFSTKFHVTGLFLSYPIVDLESGATLTLSFDDLDADVKDYFYTIVHCDRDWEPSDLLEMEYIDGFTEERITNYEFSFKTFWPFTHYELTLPNRDMRWTKPGNYLLKVYDDTEDRTLVLTRRFVVFDSRVKITPKMMRAAQVSKLRTHQEIDFVVSYENFNINSPQQEIRATVLQNGRWDNAITDIEPKFIRPGEIRFDHQDRIVFPGGKEFRFADLRSLRRVSFNVLNVERTVDGYVVDMKTEQRRDQLAYTTFNDLNGNFIIETTDQRDNVLSSEYVDVFFTLEADYRSNIDLYLFGAFTDWRIQEPYKMEYDAASGAYRGAALLKQGYYNYAYAAVEKVPNSKRPKILPQPDMSVFEGNSTEAINEYSIIIYYRPFGSRFDMPIGSVTFSSNF
ncbi:MAG: DUF5103 domain-containing protein [Chitinophagales bacterium]|nr:DUF5103 domain-containing protein [Chitinophagales bacterium]